MNTSLNEKHLKLLANPHKLKSKKIYRHEDKLKNELEYKFNYSLTNTLYQHILDTIRTELIIDSVIQDLINQVILDHNP